MQTILQKCVFFKNIFIEINKILIYRITKNENFLKIQQSE